MEIALRTWRSQLSAWAMAIRPKTLSAGLIPMAVGTFIVDLPLGLIDWLIAFCAMLCSITITITVNFFNDALDFKRGADTAERLGPLRVTQAGLLTADEVLKGAFCALLVAALLGIPLVLKGGAVIFVLLVTSFICSFLYTGGPYPLAYIGLGEVFVILFYGLFSTSAAYFLQTQELDWKVVLSALEMGFLCNVLLAINNLRDIEGDKKSGKKTLAVRMGISFARREIAFLLLVPFALNLFWIFTNHPLAGIFPLTALPISINLLRKIYQQPPSKVYNQFFGEASLLLLFFGILMILGFRLT